MPAGADGRVAGDEKQYNEAAASVMKENGVALDDLHAFAAPQLVKIQREKNVHFTPEGSKVLAAQVAARIREALGR